MGHFQDRSKDARKNNQKGDRPNNIVDIAQRMSDKGKIPNHEELAREALAMREG